MDTIWIEMLFFTQLNYIALDFNVGHFDEKVSPQCGQNMPRGIFFVQILIEWLQSDINTLEKESLLPFLPRKFTGHVIF